MINNPAVSHEFAFEIPEAIEKNADLLYFKKGQVVYFEGSTPLGVYLIRQGNIKISKLGSHGKEQIVRIASDKEVLNYIDVFSNSRYSSTAKALEDTSLLFIPKSEFLILMREQHHLFEQMVLQLSLDMKNVEEKIVDLAYKPVKGRLADAMLILDKKFNKTHTNLHSINITRADLAGFVGTVKETVNRFLSEFRNEELITTNGTKINILDLNGLTRISKMYD